MTTTKLDRYRWARTKADPGPIPAHQLRPRDVVGEVKPHNSRGISAGLDQLVHWTSLRPKALPQLITYRQVRGEPTRYQVLAADRAELGTALADRRARRPARIDTWHMLGIVTVPQAARTIELWKCPTLLGNAVEKHVRDTYAAAAGIPRLPKKDAHASGPDITHELREMAEFLRELAAELEAETY